MVDVEKLLELVVEKHGDRLDFNNGEEYFLFLRDGYINLSIDMEEGALAVQTCRNGKGNTHVFKSDLEVADLLGD